MKNHILILLAILLFTSCDKDDEPTTMQVNFAFSHFIGGEALELENQTYTLPSGENFTPRKFKYYLSNITFTKTTTAQSHTVRDGYFLIDEAGKKSFSVEVPRGDYDQVAFYVGIDKAHNLSTDQVGDLDPNNDMVWNWNTGYKFLVLEGEWKYQSEDRNGLVIHIGNNDPESEQNFKKITFDLNAAGKSFGDEAVVDLAFEAELSEMFKDPHPVVIHELENTSIMGGEWAINIANNYQEGLFTLK